MEESNRPFVSIIMITYGHEKYIKQSVEGVLNQVVDFSIEIIIADDCSPDNTSSVINELIENNNRTNCKIKYTLHKENKGINKNYIWAINQSVGKYICFCDTDDYWTDTLKLQKQVYFLENNLDYGMIHTQINYKFSMDDNFFISKTDRGNNNFIDIIYKNSISNMTTCIRSQLIFDYIKEVKPEERPWVPSDLPMWLWISLHSKIHYLEEVTGMYRVLSGSGSNTNSSQKYLEYIASRRSIKEFFINKYQLNEDLLQFVAEDFYKDAEYHVLKLRDKQVINEIGNYFYSKKKKMFLTLYFVMMEKIFNYKLLYQFWFNVYRVYYKFIKKHYKYEQ